MNRETSKISAQDKKKKLEKKASASKQSSEEEVTQKLPRTKESKKEDTKLPESDQVSK
ncbi:hypothetical protein A2U01_0056404 [Trifolium medium]|uniref:Uncharacterized protein n=1 Tax=Trifolium medium TaxID=97028 RepID=A0A392REY0_9FABA|nr:hypothetical protein [Trifolium medium]